MSNIARLISSASDLADQAVIIPTCLAIILCLGAMRWWRAAFAMIVVGTLTEGSILALKLLFASCGEVARETDIFSPSGHTAAAALIGGAAAVLIWARHPRRAWIAAGCAAAAALAIGVTRLALHAHTVADVAAALPIGVFGAAMIAWIAGPPSTKFRPAIVMIMVFLVVVSFHGTHLRAETYIKKASQSLDCRFE